MRVQVFNVSRSIECTSRLHFMLNSRVTALVRRMMFIKIEVILGEDSCTMIVE